MSQVRTLEWVAISFSRGSSPPGNQTPVSHVSCRGWWALCCSATGGATSRSRCQPSQRTWGGPPQSYILAVEHRHPTLADCLRSAWEWDTSGGAEGCRAAQLSQGLCRQPRPEAAALSCGLAARPSAHTGDTSQPCPILVL